MARPSDYTEHLADTICDRLAEGESLRAICRDEQLPSTTTVKRWLRKHEAFRAQYAQAREDQAEHFLDEILLIADDNSRDTVEIEIAPGVKALQVDHDVIQRSKLRVDTRKWAMSKLAPKKYGDRLDLTSGGEKLAPQFYVLPNGTRVEF